MEGFAELADDLEDFSDEAESAAEEIPEAVDEGLFQSANEMRTTAERLAPDGPERDDYDRREKLNESLYVKKTDDGWVWGTDAGHARPIEFGAGPHLIQAQNQEYLEFEWPDAPSEVQEQFSETFPTVRFEEVSHPGNSPSPFFRPAFEAHKEDVTDNISDNIERVFDRNF